MVPLERQPTAAGRDEVRDWRAEIGDRRYHETMFTPSKSESIREEQAAHEAQPARAVALPGPGDRVVRRLTVAGAGASLLSGLLLLVQDVAPVLTGSLRHAWLAASALLLAGFACLGLASAARAHTKDLFMRLSLGAAFILWGIQQLLRESGLSVMLGDIVIILFIVDLGAIAETTFRGPNRTPADGIGSEQQNG